MAQTFQTGFRTTLAQKLDVADTTIELATAPTVTKGRMHIYKGSTHAWIKYTGVTGTTLTGVTFVSQTADPATTVTGTAFSAGTAIELVEMHDQMLDKQEGGIVAGDVSFTGAVETTESFKLPVYADATARDAGIPSPSNGMLIYNTALGGNQQYIGGAWTDSASGTTANATTTVAGKVEIATTAEAEAGTDTGGTGASLSILPSQLVGAKQIQETQYESTIAAMDIVGQTPDGIYKVIQEVKTSTAFGTAVYLDHCVVSTGKYLIAYTSGGNINIVVGTLSSADEMTYGTPTVVTAAATPTLRMALINTNKIVICYAPTVTTNVTSVVATVSGTTVSIGSSLSEAGAAANSTVGSVFKVRTDVYGYSVLNSTSSAIKVNTVSGTTPSTGTTLGTFGVPFGSGYNTFGCYLSDNYIGTIEGSTTNGSHNVRLYLINGGATTINTTYTGTITSNNGNTCSIARYSDTELILTPGDTTEKSIYTVPGAGTTLTKTALTVNAGVGYRNLALYSGIYANHTGSAIIIQQRDVTIGTILSAPATTNISPGLQYDNGRLVFFNGGTLIPTIVNLAQVFKIGVAYNTSGKFTLGNNYASKTGVVKGYKYYMQNDGSISNTLTLTNTALQVNFIGRGVLTDKISIEI